MKRQVRSLRGAGGTTISAGRDGEKAAPKGSGRAILDRLEHNRPTEPSGRSAEEIDRDIQLERGSWE
jgi:hypothetical protein